MSKAWLFNDVSSNIFKQTYVKDFIDVSGDIYIRNGSLVTTGDVSMNGNVNCNSISLTTPFVSSGVNSDIQTALDGKHNSLTAGTNVSFDGATINASFSGGVNSINYNGSEITISTNTNISENLSVLGNISVNGSYVHSSDDRLKVDEMRIENALETIDKLKPNTYTKNNQTESGLVVQDIWYNTPELRHLVHTTDPETILDISGEYDYNTDLTSLNWDNEPAKLDYCGLLSYITKGIQELDCLLIENKSNIENL